MSGIKHIDTAESPEPGTVDVTIEASEKRDIRKDIFSAFSDAKLPILQMRSKNMTLEEIFLHLTSVEKSADEKEAV